MVYNPNRRDRIYNIKKMVAKNEREHYVDNKEFSKSVADYARALKKARERSLQEPLMTPYIGSCLLKIADGLSRKPNFSHYSYREEMVSDAIENCVKAVQNGNYDAEAVTRTGSPNAFAYFTQICYYAFLRRISKEKKQQDIKLAYIEQCGISELMETSTDNTDRAVTAREDVYVETLKKRMPDRSSTRKRTKSSSMLESFMAT